MGLIKYEPNESRYIQLFSQQHGFGMPKYRGSPMTGGNFWGRVVGFARGLFSKAAPHLTNAITQAKPHVRTLATKAIESAIDSAVDHVSQKIRKVQEGKGIKGTTRKRGIKKTKKRRFIDRLPDRL